MGWVAQSEDTEEHPGGTGCNGLVVRSYIVDELILGPPPLQVGGIGPLIYHPALWVAPRAPHGHPTGAPMPRDPSRDPCSLTQITPVVASGPTIRRSGLWFLHLHPLYIPILALVTGFSARQVEQAQVGSS